MEQRQGGGGHARPPCCCRRARLPWRGRGAGALGEDSESDTEKRRETCSPCPHTHSSTAFKLFPSVCLSAPRLAQPWCVVATAPAAPPRPNWSARCPAAPRDCGLQSQERTACGGSFPFRANARPDRGARSSAQTAPPARVGRRRAVRRRWCRPPPATMLAGLCGLYHPQRACARGLRGLDACSPSSHVLFFLRRRLHSLSTQQHAYRRGAAAARRDLIAAKKIGDGAHGPAALTEEQKSEIR